jgi:hypothetical protein
MHPTSTTARTLKLVPMTRHLLAGVTIAAAAALLGACADDLTVPNYNSPTPDGIAGDPIGGLQLGVAGILGQDRASYATYVNNFGILGRESYNYFSTDARSHTHFVLQNPLDPAGFANGAGTWTGPYLNMRNLFNFRATVAAASLSDAQKSAANGFAGTYEAYTLMMVIAQRHDYGAVVEIVEDPLEPQPFVSRDSVQNWVAGRLEASYAQLTAGGAAFPFALHAGFATNGNFNTPASFARYNRALKARIDVWRASLKNPACGANGVTCYQSALTALQNSFIDPAGNLYTGVYHIFSAESGDSRNPLNAEVNPDTPAHPSLIADAPRKADGTPDDRYAAKIVTLPAPRAPSGGAVNGIATPIGFQIYRTPTAPAPIIRNEELILIRAEARYFTGDQAGALADINTIRTRSGGLAPITSFANADAFVTELLAQRRLSLLREGHRWVDVRRFGRLATLPKDLPTMFIHAQQPIPAAECDTRRRLATNLQCPAAIPGI